MSPSLGFFSLSSAQLRAREGEWMAFVNAWHLARVKPQHVACFHPAGQGSCSAGCWLHRLLSLQTKSAPVKTAGNTCNWQPLSFKDPDCRSTQIPDIYTISMSHTQLLKNQYFNCLTFPTNTCKLKTMRSRNSFILQQGFFSALIFERFLLGISIWGQNCTYESCG